MTGALVRPIASQGSSERLPSRYSPSQKEASAAPGAASACTRGRFDGACPAAPDELRAWCKLVLCRLLKELAADSQKTGLSRPRWTASQQVLCKFCVKLADL